MSQSERLTVRREHQDWLAFAGDGQGAGGLVSSPYDWPGFFVGWVAIGVLMAAVLVRRGHDARVTVALGAGLGPLMAIVVSEAIRHRDPAASALILEPGVDRGGWLDVLVLVQGDPADVTSLRPTLDAVRGDVRRLTVARAIDYEWIEGDLDNEMVTAGRDALGDAAARLPALGAELALWPGRVDVVAERFRRRHRHGLVLLAVSEPSDGAAVSG